ncbi:MAG: Na/Pi symporter [Actinobacteria bacterium]|nr:Na/Pi symporter [Actinomycetota bacterium]
MRTALVLALLYLFLVGVSLLESGIKHLGAGFQEGLLESVTNPLAGLFAGVLATVLVQSSSVSTATIVGLVGSGTLTVEAAIPMIMGANIGTTITNTLASLGSIRRSDEFRRAFAGATMHDFFNLIAVALFLPLELVTGFLSRSAEAIADLLGRSSVTGAEASSPVKEAVKLPSEAIVSAIDGIGLATAVAGVVILTVGLGFIFLALTYITRNMRQLIAGRIERTMNRLIGKGGGFAGIVIGMLVTIAVQSSSITTSILVPMVAAGVLTLPNAYPVTLGANVGTTVTALLASLAVELPAGLVIALVHTLFNVAGIALLYPLPGVRLIPVRLAEGLAEMAVRNRSMVVAYVLGTFVLVPMAGIVILR